MLSQELPLDCLFRLFDTFMAGSIGFELHPFLCLAILQSSKEELVELEFSGLKGYLYNLPQLDMDMILMQAHSIYQEVETMKLLE